MHRTVIGASLVAAAATAVIGAGSAQAASGGGCTLHGVANFNPGVGPAAAFKYSFSGDLSNCESNAGTPSSGTIAAGTTVTSNGATYQLPLSDGAGAVPGNSCAAGTTSGTSVVTWANGKHTVIGYSTKSAGAAVELDGKVVPSVTATLVSGPAGSAPTLTISSDEPTLPVGDTADGALAFEVANPTQCAAGGVTSANIDGAVGVGQLP